MKQPREILAEEKAMRSIVSLTSAFESLSSMKIMQTKGKVLISNQFFSEVWNIYKQIRVDTTFNFGRSGGESVIEKELIILITAPGGLSGDIDQRLVRKFRDHYSPEKNDIIVIGRHGAQQLDMARIHYIMYFDLPQKEFINVDPLVVQIRKYRSSRVFYQHYMSLTTQDVRDMDISDVVKRMGKAVDIGAAHLESTEDDEIITEETYIFEPSPYAVTSHLESSMIRLTLTQFIYDSRLAQLASRFRAMSAAKERSTDEVNMLHTQYSRAKRMLIDTRLKEAQAGLKKLRQEAAG